MITQLFELTVNLNNRTINVINSDMRIHLEWDVELVKTEDTAKLKFIFKKLYGRFTIQENRELYMRTSEYKFSTDETWKYTQLLFDSDSISPESVILNFDDKSVKIKF